MHKSLKELAELVGGRVAGNAEVTIKGVAPLESAGDGDISFIASTKYAEYLDRTGASAIIVPPEIERSGRNLIVSDNPQLAFARIVTLFTAVPYKAKGIDRRAFIGRNPSLGSDLSIYPMAYVGDNVKIGDRTTLYPGSFIGSDCVVGSDVVVYPNVVVMDRCIIGDRVIIHPGAVIGGDGFGYARDGRRHYKIPQNGIVRIDNDVEIGANAAVDRATHGRTWIKRGTKIDNLVQVAHNVEVGEDCLLISQAGIAGSSRLGNNVVLAGQAGLADHVNIGDNVVVGAKGGIISDVEPNQVVSGSPALPHREWLKASMIFTKLPEMNRELKDLRRRLESLEEQSKTIKDKNSK